MKKLILLLIFASILFACTGDCIQCHKVLEKSIEKKHHKILKTCINCHTKVPQGMSECGGDCFACHSQNNLIKSSRIEHQSLLTCKECHVNKEDLGIENFDMNDNSSNLIDFLNQR